MKQVLVKSGSVHVEEVPAPSAMAGQVRVRVAYSAISSGTESSFVSEGGAAGYLLKKARDPLNVEKVKRKLATVGVKSTLEVVKDKLLAYQSPGYSTAGIIESVGRDVQGLRAGDRVACAGVGYACHAEYNVVPQQLVTPVPDDVALEDACFVALGAIALQGVRRAELTLGETIVVQGLGLIGLLTLQIAKAAGCRVIGADLRAERRELARELGADAVAAPEDLAGRTAEETAGRGADAVLVCAASKSSGVANQAIDLCRVRGRVCVVGAVGMDLQREGLYQKEVDFRLSCSYGPGRYQPAYEEKGLDYPIGYVRWTEGRNMEAFLQLLARRQVRVKPLVSLTKHVNDAAEAYTALQDSERNIIAAVLNYGVVEETAVQAPAPSLSLRGEHGTAAIGVAVIGAGAYARAYHLPTLQRMRGVRIEGVVARTGPSAKQAGERFGAAWCGTDYRQALDDPKVQAVIVATRHNLHEQIALDALEAGKHVFVEKPLALSTEACERITAAVEETRLLAAVGFNRRFSPLSQQMKSIFKTMAGAKFLTYRCNAGSLPPNHWTLDPDEGGGRILGEAVHFLDFCRWIYSAEPERVQAERLSDYADDLLITLAFADGSIAQVLYATVGHAGMAKERIELLGGGQSVILDDYQRLHAYGDGRSMRLRRQDKGQAAILEHFLAAVRGEVTLSVTAWDGLQATAMAEAALHAAANATT